MTDVARENFEAVRISAWHIARGCRSQTAHNPALYLNEIEAALNRIELRLRELEEAADAELIGHAQDARDAYVQDVEAELALLRKRLSQIRPWRDTERAVLLRQDDVVHEARRLSNAVGEINTTRELDRALKRYDDAVEAYLSERSA